MKIKGNYILLKRTTGQHEFFKDKAPWVRLMWIDLLCAARYDEYQFKWDGIPYVLKRGECIVKEKILANAYKTSQSTVHRALRKMELAGMIKREFLVNVGDVWGVSRNVPTGASSGILGGTLVTICNYNKFQPVLEDE